jgi:hypothetical protein
MRHACGWLARGAAVVVAAMVTSSTTTDPLSCTVGSGTGYLTAAQGCGGSDVARLASLLEACGGVGSSAGLTCGASGPDGTNDVIVLTASMASTPAERLRVQSALLAVRREFTARSAGDDGATPDWVVPLGGYITAVDTARCASYVVTHHSHHWNCHL